jgi:hypothetical protein
MTALRPFALALAFFALLALGLPARTTTCPFCTQELGRTMVEDYGKSSLVVFGTFSNPRQADGFIGDGKTDFEIEAVIKPNDIIKGVKKITIPKYVNQPKVKFLLFCDVYKGRIDAFRADGIAEGGDLVEYLKGAVKYHGRPLQERLAYCFDFLNSKEFEVSLDAYREFAAADYKDYRDMAGKLDPRKLIGWLDDPKTPPYRFGLYASLLGHCGKGAADGDFLRKLILNHDRHKGSGLDGMLVGYVMVQPKEGWEFLEHEIIANPKNDFNTRYAGLRSLRFMHGQRPDLVDAKTLTRAILRFALQSPMKQATDYVAVQRQRDPDQVRDTEEILKLEPDPVPTPTEIKK